MTAGYPDRPDELSLSPEVERRLEAALSAFASGVSPHLPETLRAALKAAGDDARERRLRPEELILVFKSMEERIRANFPDPKSLGAPNVRTRMVAGLLEAYFERVDAEADRRDELRRELERAIVSLKEEARINDAERAVADYCRERHRAGAPPETVIVEVKQIALPILQDNYHHLEKLVAKCIQHFYGDEASAN